MNKTLFCIVIMFTFRINARYEDVAFEAEPDLLRFRKDDDYFYFPGDGDGKLYVVANNMVTPVASRSSSKVKENSYWLYTRKNINESQELIIDEPESVTMSHYDSSKDTVFIVHGWKGNRNNTVSTLLTSVFLGDDDVNVIVVDYSEDADLLYILALVCATKVGSEFGKFIKFMNTLGMSYEKTHLVGFSLGGHIVGIAGRYVNGEIKRITALDPAGPLWYDNDARLKRTDAKYVEVIHTNMLVFGFDGRLGDADFYPNGGVIMPECGGNTCSHTVSYYYMAQTVKYNNMLANECKNFNEVGIDLCEGSVYPMGNSDLTKNGTGIFRVDTPDTTSNITIN